MCGGEKVATPQNEKHYASQKSRRAIQIVEGKMRIAQRFAVDSMCSGRDGRKVGGFGYRTACEGLLCNSRGPETTGMRTQELEPALFTVQLLIQNA